MKKFVMGLLVGAALSFSVSAYAEDIKSLIGKQVEGETPVVLSGKELPVKAVIIDGSSYAPVRAIGEAVGKVVDWKDGKVILNEKEVASVTDSEQKYSRMQIEGKIGFIEADLHGMKVKLDQYPDRIEDVEQWKQDIANLEAELKVWQQRLSEVDIHE